MGRDDNPIENKLEPSETASKTICKEPVAITGAAVLDLFVLIVGDRRDSIFSGKVLIKEVVRGFVLDFILDNPYKLGFVVLIREWFRDWPDETVYPVLLNDRCRQRGLFEKPWSGRCAAMYRGVWI